MCEVLCVSRSGYYAWCSRRVSQQARRRQRLLVEIRAEFEKSRRTYGSPRITQALRRCGVKVAHGLVERLMRQDDLRARPKRRFVRTTDSSHKHPVAPNLIERDFDADAPNRKWFADITFLPTDQGWLYLAVVLDAFSRAVVGWAMDSHHRAELVLRALEMAVERRRPPVGLIHHSDRGSEYASNAYRDRLAAHGMVCSMSRTGDCYDNAVAESFFATLENSSSDRAGERATKPDSPSSTTSRRSTTAAESTRPSTDSAQWSMRN